MSNPSLPTATVLPILSKTFSDTEDLTVLQEQKSLKVNLWRWDGKRWENDDTQLANKSKCDESEEQLHTTTPDIKCGAVSHGTMMVSVPDSSPNNCATLLTSTGINEVTKQGLTQTTHEIPVTSAKSVSCCARNSMTVNESNETTKTTAVVIPLVNAAKSTTAKITLSSQNQGKPAAHTEPCKKQRKLDNSANKTNKKQSRNSCVRKKKNKVVKNSQSSKNSQLKQSSSLQSSKNSQSKQSNNIQSSKNSQSKQGNSQKRSKIMSSTQSETIQRKRKVQEHESFKGRICSKKALSHHSQTENSAGSSVNEVNSSVSSAAQTTVIPSIAAIKQKFATGTITCSLCHLPANFFPGLGDLYGPYRPSSHDIMDKYDAAQLKTKKKFDDLLKTVDETGEPEMRFHENVCYITSGHGVDTDGVIVSPGEIPIAQNTEAAIVRASPWLRMLQSVDNVLMESNKKHSSSRAHKKLHIPGFTGTVVLQDDSGDDVNQPSNDLCLPKVDSVVFIEPTVDICYGEDTSTNYLRTVPNSVTPRRQRRNRASRPVATPQSTCDKTSIQICHKFDTRELWVHAMCAIWTPGIYAVQNQIFGIHSTVQSASLEICDLCGRPGASVSSIAQVQRIYHYPCALSAKFTLDQETFRIRN